MKKGWILPAIACGLVAAGGGNLATVEAYPLPVRDVTVENVYYPGNYGSNAAYRYPGVGYQGRYGPYNRPLRRPYGNSYYNRPYYSQPYYNSPYRGGYRSSPYGGYGGYGTGRYGGYGGYGGGYPRSGVYFYWGR